MVARASESVGGLREARREATQGRIVSAAMGVITREGFDALTVGRLASELAISPSALYRYVASKDEVMARVLAEVVAELTEDLRAGAALVASSRVSPADLALSRLVALFDVYVTLDRRRPEHLALIAMFASDPRVLVGDEAAARVAASLSDATALVREAFDDAAAQGALTPGPWAERASALWLAVHGVMAPRKLTRLGPLSVDRAAAARSVVLAMLASWGAPADRLALAARRAHKAVEGSPLALPSRPPKE